MGGTILPLMNRPFDISSGILFLLIFVPFSSNPLRTGCPYIGHTLTVQCCLSQGLSPVRTCSDVLNEFNFTYKVSTRMWFDTVSNILPFRTQLKTCSESAMMLPGNDVFKPLTRFLGHRFKDMRCRIFHQNRTPAVMTEIDAGASLLSQK